MDDLRARPVLSLLVAGLALLAAACGGEEAAPTRLVVLTHDSFAVSDGVLELFESENGIAVEVLKGGDAGEMVNKAILTEGAPLADVLFGVDNTFLSRALEAGIFQEYESPLLDGVDPSLRIGDDHRVTPIDFGDVCINYDRSYFAVSPPPPAALADVADPAYRGLLAVQDPASSSPGLAFLMATVGVFGEEGDYTWLDFWRELRDNDVLVASDWEQAYFEAYTVAGGDRPLVVSYASSPPAEVYYADPPVPEAPSGVVTAGCFRQVEYAGVLRGTGAAEQAARFIDFMLSSEFQEDIPLQMFVFPALAGTALPDVFVDNTEVPGEPVTLSPQVIEQNRERWIREWTTLMRG